MRVVIPSDKADEITWRLDVLARENEAKRAAIYSDLNLQDPHYTDIQYRKRLTPGGKIRLGVMWVVGLAAAFGVVSGIVYLDGKGFEKSKDKFSVTCDKLGGEVVNSVHDTFECIKDETIVFSANL